jgi:type II secretory pathway component PulK
MVKFIHRNMALLLATVMTALAIAVYNMIFLLVRHHHTVLHDIRHAVSVIVLFGIFYAIVRYIQALPEDAD